MHRARTAPARSPAGTAARLRDAPGSTSTRMVGDRGGGASRRDRVPEHARGERWRRRPTPARGAHLVGSRGHRARRADAEAGRLLLGGARPRACGGRGARGTLATYADGGAHARRPRRAHHVRAQVPALARGRSAGAAGASSTALASAAPSASSPAPWARWRTCDPAIEVEALGALGLRPEPVANQVVQRDRHAALLAAIAVLGGTLERIALEIRHLQRTEVREAEEPFGEKQKGSSAMPHKRNPVRCERICGHGASAARVCARRIRGPGAVARTRHQPLLGRARGDPRRLPGRGLHGPRSRRRARGVCVVRPERMRANLESGGGLVYSQRVLLALTGGRARRATRRSDRAASRARVPPTAAPRSATRSPRIRRWRARLDPGRLAACFDLAPHLRHVDALFARARTARRREPAGRPSARRLDARGGARSGRGRRGAAPPRRVARARGGHAAGRAARSRRPSGRRRCCSGSCGASTVRTSRRGICSGACRRERPNVVLGPGEDAGVVRLPGTVRRSRAGARPREPQPSEPGAAGRGRGHRRRWHRPRRRVHGRRGGRRASTRCVSAIRRERRSRCATSCAASSKGSPTYAERARRSQPRRRHPTSTAASTHNCSST